MTNNSRQGSSLWIWLIIALIVAAIAVGTLYYIGWFNTNTHVDTPAGDNVEQQYVITEAQADAPGEADWQNADGESLRQAIVDPESETATPPVPASETEK